MYSLLKNNNNNNNNYHSPGLVQVAERRANYLLDFAPVDVDAGAERGSEGSETMATLSTSLIASRQRADRDRGKTVADNVFSAAEARDGAVDRERTCCSLY